jgi:hypothetical protein
MSPIKGLTDQQAQFPRIGVLRKGGEKPVAGNKPGPDLKHFRFTDADESATAAFSSIYGDTPTQIRVLLPYPKPEQNFVAWLEEYTASSLIRRCDGETIVMQRAGVRYDQTPRPCLRAQGKPCNCKQSGRLFVIIPELKRAGYVVALTTSKHDIINLSAQLAAAAAIVGDLAFRVPFILSRKPAKITTPTSDGKTARREKWLLSIEIDPMFVQAKLSAMQRDALLMLGAPAELPIDEGDDEDDDAQGAVISRSAPAPISIEAARARYIDAVKTAMDVVGQLSRGGHEARAVELDQAIGANRATKDATADQISAAVAAIIAAVGNATAEDGETQAAVLASEAPAGEGDDQPEAEPAREITERVKHQVSETTARYGSRTATDKQKQLAFLVLREACGNDDAKRHTVQAQVFGVKTFEALTDAQMLALIDWLKPYKNGDGRYHANADAVKDAEAIVREALVAAGQQPLM